jgi:choline dehydrogenase-like flavoprotein
MTDSASVVIVGSGMGGGTLAWGLAQRGIDVLVVERGDYLPQEKQNWSPEAVFVQRRYKPSEMWVDDDGHEFSPGVHYVVGGNTKVYGSSLPRLREQDFERTEYPSGVSPAWPFSYADLEPYYGHIEELFRVHGTTGEDPSEPWRSAPFPYPALEHEPYVAETIRRLRDQGVHPSSTAMGIDLRPGGACIRCSTCDGFPCRLGAKSDAQTCGIDPAVATGRVRVLTNAKVDRLVTQKDRVVAVEGNREGEPFRITGGAFVVAAGAANSAALLLRSANDENPKGVANRTGLVGRNYMVHNNTHIAAVDPRRKNDVVFQKTVAVNDFYRDMGDGYPGGTIQLIGKVQGSMMKTHVTKVPLPVLNRIAGRSMEWLVMSEDLPSPHNRVSVDREVASRCPGGAPTTTGTSCSWRAPSNCFARLDMSGSPSNASTLPSTRTCAERRLPAPILRECPGSVVSSHDVSRTFRRGLVVLSLKRCAKSSADHRSAGLAGRGRSGLGARRVAVLDFAKPSA